MTAQEIFNTVVAHLRQQKKRAMVYNEDNGLAQCLYRAPDGLKCAVGCLIPDGAYKPSFEGNAVEVVLYESDEEPWAKNLLPHSDLLMDLQWPSSHRLGGGAGQGGRELGA